MKANEFVKTYGWDEAKAFLSFDSDVEIVYTASFFDVLKRLVESHTLVESCGGLDKAKKKLSTEQSEPYYNYSQQLVDSLKQAIANVESCL